ncbi:toprim domain-containing protein [Candidatus Carsonella ruddii]|uniref:DNA primase n=1 Tax=Candidatus Carsonella ruddii (Diaphorina cf. continua) TaxID=2661587 RepID=A0A7R6VZ95_CARRU|nr:toprim domain-containing protein [Candidatus Carsonella ruddii (Diaphorina cf. continua)]BCG49286.1 DNA primase [Candidatus Carsonella ruddii (Diaphorina cf. continua)]
MNIKCPFHNDNNASLSLKNKKVICYGCNFNGNSIDFLKIKQFKLSFNKKIVLEAKENLYKKKNIWLNYLLLRNINMKISLKFNLGFLDFSYKNKVKNILLNRLIFPILNENNLLIGIGLKTNNDKNKYLNFFKKYNMNEIFYGINNIIDYNFILIVEGYFDLLTLNKNNFVNVVSNLGCNVNSEKIFFLLKKFKKIYFCFDGDEAGYEAYIKVKNISNSFYNKRMFSKTMPYSYDPDNYINNYGIKSFLRYLKI